ncbi:major facilitator superfamily domain-containing protein [Flagelloscypha sp. PMI_526]|nr:major facilitator superfamily domain-containing protein [Flagelloscypha sp. PMI_526]
MATPSSEERETTIIVESYATEQTPLLLNTAAKDNSFSAEKPFPTFQLTIVFLIQLCEPITSGVIYPFINQFVRATGITNGDENKTGYYAGIIESIFFYAEGFTALPWQLVSDRIGRRIPMLIAPLGLALVTAGFGISTSFSSLVIFRAGQGILNGDIGVSKTVLIELAEPSQRAEVLSWMPIVWSLGTILAPCIGGVFASPADRWPNSIGHVQIFRDHPYFLPCLISAGLALIAFFLAAFGLKETSPTILRKRKAKSLETSETGQVLEEDSSNASEQSFLSILNRPVLLLLAVHCFFNLSTTFYSALQPLVWSTSIENGGLGFDAFTIGTANTVFAVPNAILQFLFLSKSIRAFGPKAATVTSFVGSVVLICLFPLQTYFARENGVVDWRVWSVITIQLATSMVFYAGYGSIMFFAIDASPNPESMGTIQGLLQTVGVIVRGLAPAMATSLYAFSHENDVLGGNFVYAVLALLCLFGVCVSMLLPRISA